MKQQLPADIKTLLASLLPLLASVLVFVVILKFGFGKISEVRLKVNDAKKNQTVLTQKLDVLNEVSADILTSSSISSVALPEANPSLSVISQLRRLAVERAINLTNIKTSAEIPDKSGLKRVDVTFDVEGPRVLVLDFFSGIEKFAPISMVEKVKLNEVGGSTRGSVVVKSFWAELPKKLPSLTEKLNDLTNDERATLGDIAALTQPSFVSVPPSDVSGRSDPFSF
jgi:hypothetical protein